ncbi:MAG TPA: T9SS type A sorting domain-containing protein [Puia sp.]
MKQFVPSVCASVLFFTGLRTDAQTTTPATNGTAAADVPFTGSSQVWSTPSGALAAGGGSASINNVAQTSLLSNVNIVSDNLQLTDFGFAIPSAATIVGVTASETRQATGLNATLLGFTLFGSVVDNSVKLVGAGVTSSNLASGSGWSGTSSTVTYGGASNLWGAALTPAIVNDPTFGFAHSVNLNGNSNALLLTSLIPGANIDNVTLAVTYTMPIVLPVRLTDWSVTHQEAGNVLKWSASTTDRPGQFIIERSSNGKDWSDLANVAAPMGQTNYGYTDDASPQSGPAYYRLRLHSNGAADVWSTIQVISTVSRPVITLYPNPFTDIINVAGPRSFTNVSVTNIQGQVIWKRTFGTGTTQAQVPASGLPHGTYFVQVDGSIYKLIKN